MPSFHDVQNRIGAAQPVAFAGGHNLQPGDKGPKSITCVCDFSASDIPGTGYTIDVSPFFNRDYLKTIQTIFLDNSANNGYALVYNQIFNQSFALPPGWQGYFPTLCPKGSGGVFNVTSTGNGSVNVQLINVSMPLGQWAGTVTPPTVGTPQPVSDAILDGTVSGGRQKVTTLSDTEILSIINGGRLDVKTLSDDLLTSIIDSGRMDVKTLSDDLIASIISGGRLNVQTFSDTLLYSIINSGRMNVQTASDTLIASIINLGRMDVKTLSDDLITTIINNTRMDVTSLDKGYFDSKNGVAFAAHIYAPESAIDCSGVQLWNPSSSNVNLIVDQFNYLITPPYSIQISLVSTEMGGGDTGQRINKLGAGGTSQAINHRQSGVGRITPLAEIGFALSGGGLYKLSEPFIIPPGYGLTFETPLANSYVGMDVEYVEVAI